MKLNRTITEKDNHIIKKVTSYRWLFWWDYGWFMAIDPLYLQLSHFYYIKKKGKMVANILLTTIAIGTIGILIGSIYALFASIFFFIFSGGDEERKKKWFNSLRYMIIGLIITILLLFLVPYLFVMLGLPWAELFNASNVLLRVRQILNYLLNFGGLWGDYVNDTILIDGSLDSPTRQSYGNYQL